MGMSSFLCFILADAFVVLAMSSAASGTVEIASIPSSISLAPASSSNTLRTNMIRKLGKHEFRDGNFIAPCPSPSEAIQSEENAHFTNETNIHSHSQVSSIESKNYETGNAHEQDFHLKKQHHHGSIDKSVAGGGVILGGLATTFLVAVLCYLKATRRHQTEITA